MLKTTEVYAVSITLNDGKTLLCTLLSKPDSAALAAVAAAQNAPADICKVLALVNDLGVPAVGAEADTEISIVGTPVGTINIKTQTAYRFPVKRQPKADAPTDAPKRKPGRPRSKVAPVEAPAVNAGETN